MLGRDDEITSESMVAVVQTYNYQTVDRGYLKYAAVSEQFCDLHNIDVSNYSG